jgi:hypothetical protein
MKKVKSCICAAIMLFLILTSFEHIQSAFYCDVRAGGGCGSNDLSGERMNIYFEVNKNGGESPRKTRIESNPSGAKCYLDGDNTGTASLTNRDLSPRSYGVILKMNDYYDWGETVYVAAREITNVYGSLDVVSNVDGSFVYLDYGYKGTTPLKIDNVPVGSHTIEISADKYYTYGETIAVEANKTTYVDAFLEEKPGSAYVESAPSGAEVFIDGCYIGTTPLKIFNLISGTYTLTLKHPGYLDETKYINVYPDETVAELVTMQEVFWRKWHFVPILVLIMLPISILILYLRQRLSSRA